MVAALVGVVEDDHVAGLEGGATGDGRPHRSGHRPQMYRDMCRLRQHLRAIHFVEKNGTAKIQPFFDIRAIGGAAKRHPHLLRHRSKQMPKNSQRRRVDHRITQ